MIASEQSAKALVLAMVESQVDELIIEMQKAKMQARRVIAPTERIVRTTVSQGKPCAS